MSETRMNPGPLGRYVGGYRAWLLQRGYSPDSANRTVTGPVVAATLPCAAQPGGTRRHSMAVKTLVGWYRDGVDVQSRLPALSTYLGHCDPVYTYYYLSAAPELLACAAGLLDTAKEARS